MDPAQTLVTTGVAGTGAQRQDAGQLTLEGLGVVDEVPAASADPGDCDVF